MLRCRPLSRELFISLIKQPVLVPPRVHQPEVAGMTTVRKRAVTVTSPKSAWMTVASVIAEKDVPKRIVIAVA